MVKALASELLEAVEVVEVEVEAGVAEVAEALLVRQSPEGTSAHLVICLVKDLSMQEVALVEAVVDKI